MNAEKTSSVQHPNRDEDATDRSTEKEGVWQQIQQHFQTTQTSLSLRLVCEGKTVQQVGDVNSGVKEAARLFTLQDSPQKAEELVASLENLFNRKCQQWEQVAKGAEARERAKATGGGGSGSDSTAANRRKLESAHAGIRNRITNVKQCIRRLRTALNRGVAIENQKNTLGENMPQLDGLEAGTEAILPSSTTIQSHKSDENLTAKSSDLKTDFEPNHDQLEESKFSACFKKLIGDGLSLEYKNAPYLDPFSDEGLKSREAIWADHPPYCLIVQWEDSPNSMLNLKFWILPNHPELIEKLRSHELPSFFLHTNRINGAEKLDFKLAIHSTQNGPLTSEINQLLNRLEAERFLSSELQTPLYYLTCKLDIVADFDSAVKQSYLLELL